MLTENGITYAILGERSGASKRLKKAASEEGALLPLFVAPSQLKPFISKELEDGPLKPIDYQDGDRIVRGYDASVLVVVCNIWLSARQAGALQAQQLPKAHEVIAEDARRIVLVHREVNSAKRVREMIRRMRFSRLARSVPAHGRHVALLIASKRRQHEVEPIVELPEKPAFNLPQIPHSRMRSAVAGWRREGAALSRHARTVTNAHTMGQNPGVEAAQGVVNGDAA